MNTGKMVIGVVILLVGLWMLIFLNNTMARYLGGGIVTILGIAQMVMAYKKGVRTGQPMPPQQPRPPQ